MNRVTIAHGASSAREFKALALALHVALFNLVRTLTPPVRVGDADITYELEALRRQSGGRIGEGEAHQHVVAKLTREMTDALVKSVAVALINIVDARRHSAMRSKFGKLRFRAVPRPSVSPGELYYGGFRVSRGDGTNYSFEVGRLQMDHLPYTNSQGAIDRVGRDRQVEFEPLGGAATLNMGQWLSQRVFSILAKVDETETAFTAVHLDRKQPSGYVLCFEYSLHDLVRIFRNTVAAHVEFVRSPRTGMRKKDLLLLALKEGPSHFGRYVDCLLMAFGQEMMVALQRMQDKAVDDSVAAFRCTIGPLAGGGVMERSTELFVVSGAPSEMVEGFKLEWLAFRECMRLRAMPWCDSDRA